MTSINLEQVHYNEQSVPKRERERKKKTFILLFLRFAG